MTTTLEEKQQQRIPRRIATSLSSNNDSGAWARVSASVGAAVWALLAVAARAGLVRLGAIELMFLFRRWSSFRSGWSWGDC